MRKAAWSVVGAALIVGCGSAGAGELAGDDAPVADARALGGGDADPPAPSDAGVHEAAAHVVEAGVRVDADVPEDAGRSYLADALFPDAAGCQVEPDDGGDLNCCAYSGLVARCLCGSESLTTLCRAYWKTTVDAALSPAPTCYELQQAFATGLCY